MNIQKKSMTFSFQINIGTIIQLNFIPQDFPFYELFDSSFIIIFQQPFCQMDQLPQLKIQEQSNQPIQETTSISNKLFSLSGIQINYENTYIVSQLDQSYSNIVVDNYLCRNAGNKLCKYTDIMLNNIKIRIKDEILLGSQQAESQRIKPQKQKKKKIRIVKGLSKLGIQRLLETHKNQHKRDTRNTVKNIVKLFSNWLATKHNSRGKKKILRDLLQGKKYNNSLIKELAEKEQINPLFAKFLAQDAISFIDNSKIKDKQSHISVVQFYLQMLKSYRQKLEINSFDQS